MSIAAPNISNAREVLENGSAVGDPDAPTFDERTRVIRQLFGLDNSIRANVLIHVRDLKDFPIELADDGHRGVSDWLMRSLGMSPKAAKQFVSVANKIDEMPRCFDLFAQSHISWDRFELLTRAYNVEYNHDDDHWANTQAELTDAQIAAVINFHKKTPDLKEPYKARSATFRTIRAGLDRLVLDLPTDLMAKIRARSDDYLRSVEADPESEFIFNAPMSRADAIVDMVSRDIAEDGDPDIANITLEAPMGALFTQQLAETLKLRLDMHSSHGEIGWGTSMQGIENETLRRLACDALISVATIDEAGTTIGVGKSTRVVPRWLRRRLMKRDRGCRFVGCGRTNFTHAHHVVFWSDGGPTNMDNLILLCPMHHRYVHNFGWKIKGNPNGAVKFISPAGSEFLSAHYGAPPDVFERFVRKVEHVLSEDDWLLKRTLRGRTNIPIRGGDGSDFWLT